VGNLTTEVALLAWYQLDFTAGWWVHFSIWIRFSLYAVHVVLINQNSHHITILLLYCTLIYCCHSWLLHKDAATQFTDPTSTVFSHCILILHINNYSQAQFSKCSVRICYTVTNMAIMYICPSTKVFQLPWPTRCLFNKAHFLWMDNKLTHSFSSYKKCAVHKS